MKPSYYFKSIHEARLYKDTDLSFNEPTDIEFLKIWTGETFVHVGGTAYWHGDEGLDIKMLILSGVTHWRKIN